MHTAATDAAIIREKRRFPRHPADRRCLRVAGRPAHLVDWSFGGIGVMMEAGAASSETDAAGTPLTTRTAVEVDIPDRDGRDWSHLRGVVQRVESSGLVGIAFPEDDSAPTALLVRLMDFRLGEAARA